MEDPLNNPAVNEAADVFQKSIPQVKALASNLRGHALSRVFNAVMEFPLQEVYPKFRSDAEQELFAMSLACMQAKNVMLGAIMASHKRADEAIAEAAQAVTDDARAVEEAEAILRATPEELEQIRAEKGIEINTEGETV